MPTIMYQIEIKFREPKFLKLPPGKCSMYIKINLLYIKDHFALDTESFTRVSIEF